MVAGENPSVLRSNYNQRAQVARQRALRQLAANHADEFMEIHRVEREKEGLDAPDPARFKGERYVQPGDPAINKYKSGPNQWPGVQ